MIVKRLTPTPTLSQRPLCLRDVLRRIREREHHRQRYRAFFRRFFGQDLKAQQQTALPDDYEASTVLAETIIAGGAILFLTCLMVGAIALACTAYLKPAPKPLYVVQSGFIEVRPATGDVKP